MGKLGPRPNAKMYGQWAGDTGEWLLAYNRWLGSRLHTVCKSLKFLNSLIQVGSGEFWIRRLLARTKVLGKASVSGMCFNGVLKQIGGFYWLS